MSRQSLANPQLESEERTASNFTKQRRRQGVARSRERISSRCHSQSPANRRNCHRFTSCSGPTVVMGSGENFRAKAQRRKGASLSARSIALRLCAFASIVLVILCTAIVSLAQTKRLVIIKCDGLPYDLVDRLVKQRDPQSGKSLLPWIDHIFYQRGARLSNFYVRGMSLSAPSWSLLETGQHLQIKGNVEFDRYTLRSYDYLNFFPFYMGGIVGARVDMPAVEILDSLGLPLLVDAYAHDERYITMSMFLRNPRYSTLQSGVQNRFLKSPKELFDEWNMGFDTRSILTDQLVRELTAKLNDPKIRYLDLFLADFDHVGHHNND